MCGWMRLSHNCSVRSAAQLRINVHAMPPPLRPRPTAHLKAGIGSDPPLLGSLRRPLGSTLALMWCAGLVSSASIQLLSAVGRPRVVEMLREDPDIDSSIADFYASRRTWDEDYVAWTHDRAVAMMTASFGLDFTDQHSYRLLDLPDAPHALLHRLFVRASERYTGVGTALLRHLAEEATARGCTYVVGYLDRTSDQTNRRRFFERRGFSIAADGALGATPYEILARTG